VSAAPSTLVLFDIDGTIMRSQGVGVASMRRAFDAVYPGLGISMDGVAIAGRLDTLILHDTLAKYGLVASEEQEGVFRDQYRTYLEQSLVTASVRRMPGVHELVTRLAADARGVVGLLTGNWPDTARMKIAAAGFAPETFRLGAYAGDGPDRRSLPPVAMQRYEAAIGVPARPDRTVVIGDTPLDVDCAHFNGCRVIAVATGDFTVDELRATGADLVVPTLEDVDHITAWILA